MSYEPSEYNRGSQDDYKRRKMFLDKKFADKKTTKDPYTNDTIHKNTNAATNKYGKNSSTKHKTNVDHTIPLKTINDKVEKLRKNPIIRRYIDSSTKDSIIKEIANKDSNLKLTSERFNKMKGCKSNLELAKNLKNNLSLAGRLALVKEHFKSSTQVNIDIATNVGSIVISGVSKEVANTATESVLDIANLAVKNNVVSNAGSYALTVSAKNLASVIMGENELDESLEYIIADISEYCGTTCIIILEEEAITKLMAYSPNETLAKLAKSGVPHIIATSTVEIGKVFTRYIKGEIDALELFTTLGEKGTSALAGGIGGGVGACFGTMIFPVVGTAIGSVVGSMLGYMANSMLYSACYKVFKEEQISQRRYEQIKALTEKIIPVMRNKRETLSLHIEEFYKNRNMVFKESLNMLDYGEINNNLQLFNQGLDNIVIEMDGEVVFKNLNEFKDFMLDDNLKLEF